MELQFKGKNLQINTNPQTISLISIIFKLFMKLTSRGCKTRFWCAKSSIIDSISSFQQPQNRAYRARVQYCTKKNLTK